MESANDDLIIECIEQQKEIKRMLKYAEHSLKIMKTKIELAIEKRGPWVEPIEMPS